MASSISASWGGERRRWHHGGFAPWFGTLRSGVGGRAANGADGDVGRLVHAQRVKRVVVVLLCHPVGVGGRPPMKSAPGFATV